MQEFMLRNGRAITKRLQKTTMPEVDSIARRSILMDRIVDLLIEMTKAKQLWPEVYERAFSLLETLALASSEFQLARQRLLNALRYVGSHQFGAAAFELRLLRSQLGK